jgi:mannose-6-phosphate isomerase-like protein (cupin superfamily)
MSDSPGPISTQNAPYYTWGAGCDGWHLVRSAALSVIQERMPAGAAEVRHRHAVARQFFYVLAGELSLEIDGVVVTITSGRGCEVAPGCPHQARNAGGGAVEFLVVSQPPAQADRELAPAV